VDQAVDLGPDRQVLLLAEPLLDVSDALEAPVVGPDHVPDLEVTVVLAHTETLRG